MRILFTRFPLESVLGGAEIQTLSLMEGLIERGHAVAFAGSCPVLLAECRKRNIPVAELHIGKPPVTKLGALTFAWGRVAMQKKLQGLLEQFHTLDVIAMLSLSEKLLLTDAAHKRIIRVVWIEHDRIGRWLTKSPWLPLLLKHSAHATTVAVSELSRKIYEDLGWDKKTTRAIPNGIDAKRITANHVSSSVVENSPEGIFCIGCIARLSAEKGVDVLIESLAELPPFVTLEIIGKGHEELKLKTLAKKLRVSERITFTPAEKNISDAYGRFNAFVLPSRDNDPFGLVAAEAMLANVPVIVTDACGIAGYLTHGKDALITKADSSSALTQALSALIDPATRQSLGENGRKTALEKFSIKTMVDQYESVFTGSSLPPA